MPSRILLVEDDDDLREVLHALIARRGIDVDSASNGAQAIAALRFGERPKLVLLDLILPDTNGWALRAQMLADPELARIPVVVLSGVADTQEHAKALAADAALLKPVAPSQLYEVISAYCPECEG